MVILLLPSGSLRLAYVQDCVSGWLPESVFSVADVVKSFDTIDQSILDCALGRLGLPQWFRRVYFAFHCQVKLKF